MDTNGHRERLNQYCLQDGYTNEQARIVVPIMLEKEERKLAGKHNWRLTADGAIIDETSGVTIGKREHSSIIMENSYEEVPLVPMDKESSGQRKSSSSLFMTHT